MFRSLLCAFLLCTTISFSETLPKKCFGQYAGEMSAYRVVKNNIEMHVDEHDVKITVLEDKLIYSSGNITVAGNYDFIKQGNGEYLLVANMSNGKSVNFRLEIVVNYKEETLFVHGKNGEPDLNLEKLGY
ncbi:MAG: hypothetical protein HUJ25_16910 [Crocinitomicaceae bacterium]|nr:hypothetical protein [Crocinitomicaceae bacterium]